MKTARSRAAKAVAVAVAFAAGVLSPVAGVAAPGSAAEAAEPRAAAVERGPASRKAAPKVQRRVIGTIADKYVPRRAAPRVPRVGDAPATVTALPPVLSSTSTVPVPVSIVSDCSSDVSSALSAFFAGVRDGSRIEFPSKACYRTDLQVDVVGKRNLVIDGNGSTLRRIGETPPERQYPKWNHHLRLSDVQDVVVEDIAVRGTNTVSDIPGKPGFGSGVRAFVFDHGIVVQGSRRVALRQVDVDAVFGDGIYVGGLRDRTPAVPSTDVTISGGVIDRTGRQGVAVLAERVLIDGLRIVHARRSGIDLEPDSPSDVVQRIEIRNSTISSHLIALASAGWGAVDDVWFHHNTVNAGGWVWASSPGFSRNGWRVTDNWFQNPMGTPGGAIRFVHARDAVFERNALRLATSQSRRVFDIGEGTILRATCNAFLDAAAPHAARLDGTGTLIESGNSTTDAPPCLNRSAVGAPVADPGPGRAADDFRAALQVGDLAVGQSRSFSLDLTTATQEEWEGGPHNALWRSGWLRYRTGGTPETIAISTTGGLRSLRLTVGDSLWWNRTLADVPDWDALEHRLQPNTTYHLRVDGNTYKAGRAPVGTVTMRRGGVPADYPEHAVTLPAGHAVTLDNTDATAEPDETGCQANCLRRSLWVRWTAVRAGDLTVTTTGALNSLSVLVDGPAGDVLGGAYDARSLTVRVPAPGTYLVRLDSSVYGGNTPGLGTVRLTGTSG